MTYKSLGYGYVGELGYRKTKNIPIFRYLFSIYWMRIIGGSCMESEKSFQS